MSNIKYTREHVWIRLDGDVGTVGISNFAQEQFGDVVFVDLPETGQIFKLGEQVAVVESVKAASEVYAPGSGKIIEVNNILNDKPALINAEPIGQGWLFKIKLADESELEAFLDEASYKEFTMEYG